jgi:hypothetical protein
MIVWLVVVPIALSLLALAGANWKVFHLAYCKYRLRDDHPEARQQAFKMLVENHVKKGMTKSRIRDLFWPMPLHDRWPRSSPPYACFEDRASGALWRARFAFDQEGLLDHIVLESGTITLRGNQVTKDDDGISWTVIEAVTEDDTRVAWAALHTSYPDQSGAFALPRGWLWQAWYMPELGPDEHEGFID